jgi:hypothetical protein
MTGNVRFRVGIGARLGGSARGGVRGRNRCRLVPPAVPLSGNHSLPIDASQQHGKASGAERRNRLLTHFDRR